MEQIGTVQSLCPQCLAKIEGIKYVEDGKVYIMKNCADHGNFINLVSEDVNHYRQMEECFDVDRAKAREPLTETQRGCPFDCGLCPSHKQDTCLAVVEVTDRCNMKCTYCFANSSMDESLDPDMDTIRLMFETVKKCQNEPTCIQISGGEPTIRNDLPEIIRMGKEIGINHIELNTNGIRIASDQNYFDKIAAAGVDAIYLGFDGVSDDIYMQRTGRKMLDVKTEVINRCEKAGIGVVLVPLVAKGYNLHEVGSIIDFAASRVPAVRGVHFQPVFHSGRSPSDMKDKVTILELLREIEKQTNGQLKVSNFTPALMPHAHCGATCLTLIDNGGFLPLTNASMGAVKSASDVASKTKKSIMGRWKGLEKDSTSTSKSSCGDLLIKSSCCEKPLSSITVKGSCCEKPLIDILPKNSGSGKDKSGGWADFIEMSKNNYLTISTMAFQDAWSYEQDRVENCCIHVVTRDGRFVPFCNYNMSDCNGNTLYRNAR
ncbi:radical SAM protein [Methanolobus sediminis]|uniref:Radical SAM protein n=1 Tax=Methanolobus sediminis TaxID=3072978 RepID=A0AA51YJ46_9EURY|nr:radical SAM protein [Methanolobus sediminis]WMW25211.1 radical SAM protein [Methanolobus sediminis]